MASKRANHNYKTKGLFNARGSKHYKPEIGLDRLYYMLNEKWMKRVESQK
jgi:hypothetical protein